jgi:general secretion pathway protein D
LGSTGAQDPGAKPAAQPVQPAEPAAGRPAPAGATQAPGESQPARPVIGGVQAGQKIPPIQDVGNEYILTFDETGGEDALTLEAFVKICQQTTGLNFTYGKETEPALKQARLRMFGQKRIPKTDFYSFFQIMMIINDFVCSKIGPDHLSVIVISSLNQGQGRGSLRNEAVYVFSDDINRYADQPATLVTTVIDLPSTDVRTLSNSMRTMFTDANTQQIIPVGNSNSLIITGFGSNVASIVKMLRFVDDAAANQGQITPEFEVIPLEFASADEVADTLGELLEASKRASQVRVQGQAAQGVTGAMQVGQGDTKILTDPRTNSLLVMAMPADLPRIKELVARLDVDVVEKERTYHIYNLENVEAEELSKTLDDFIRDASRISTGARGATAARAGQQAQAGPTGGSSSSRNDIVVVPDKTTNSLLIAASRTRYEEIFDLIRQLDKRQDQVLIETALVELTGQDSLDIGIELGGADLPGSGTGSFGVTSFGMSTVLDTNGDGVPDVRVPNGVNGTPPIGVTAGILNGNDFSLPLLLYALQTRRDTNVLNVPSVLVNNTGSAKVVSTDEQPTTTITATGGLNGQTQENFREYVKAGITLQISPTISASRYLRLKITLEVSTFLGAVSGAIPPPKVTRTIDTTVNVPDGDTMVIGGIVTDNKGKTRSGVPFLSDIPILGALFRRDGASSSRTTLYFFVTPHIMRDRDFADLAEISYKKKLDAADIIGADRVRVIDPSFGQKPKGVDMRGFELPLYRSPVRGEVQGSAVGIEPGRVPHMLKNETRDRENASDPDSPPESEPTPAPEKP